MMHLVNQTRFPACALPLISHRDAHYVMTAVKGTFVIDGPAPLAPAAEQVPLHMEDVYWNDPTRSSLRYEADTALTKLGTDVVLIGSARARTPVRQLDVGIRVGALQKIVRVFGDRWWRKAGNGWRLTEPAPFESMPLVYENAYGGADPTGASAAFYEPNPVGKGFVPDPKSAPDSLPAPNLELPEQPIGTIEDRPPPAGFGFVARHWQPRRALMGTYDDVWSSERNPLLPADFDERSYTAASAGLCADEFLVGGESVLIINACERSRLEFALPRLDFDAVTYVDGERAVQRMNMDTVVVEPDAGTVTVTWRASIECHWNLGMIEWVKVTERA